MLTVLNALFMSSATVIVHLADLYWLKHIAMVLFKLCEATHLHPHPPHPEPNTYTSHILHQLLSSHATHSSITRQLRYTQYLNHMPCTHHNHTASIPHTSIAGNLAHSLSIHTCNTNNSTRITVSATTQTYQR